jgi:hypothetical protein
MEINFKDNAVHIVIPCGPDDIKNAPLSKSGNSRVIGYRWLCRSQWSAGWRSRRGQPDYEAVT